MVCEGFYKVMVTSSLYQCQRRFLEDSGHLLSGARQCCISLGADGSGNNEVYPKIIRGGASIL